MSGQAQIYPAGLTTLQGGVVMMNRRFALAFRAALALALLPTLLARAQSSYSYHDLGTLGGSLATPYCVNNAGQVVGYSNLASGIPHGFFWSSATGMVDMGTLVGSTGG